MIYLRQTFLVLLAAATTVSSPVAAFAPNPAAAIQQHPQHCDESTTALQMGKKLRNKQADLLKKLSLAKQQNQGSKGDDKSSDSKLSDEEMKEKNDRRRFDELLKNSVVSMNDVSSDSYLSKEQEDAEIDAYRKGVDRIFEGDPAPTQPFEELVNIKSDNALGDEGAKRVVPWLKTSNPSDYLVIVCDPRVKSPELQETVQSINNLLPKNILSRTIIVNADTPAENRRWVKKSNLQNINIYSDEKREWMRSYTALGENRWSMTMFIIADERVQKIAREMESIAACKTIENAIKAMEGQRL